MNQTILQPARNAAAVESILRELSELPPQHFLRLGDDDPFYEEPMPVRVRPASDFYDVDETAAMIGTRKWFSSADIFDLTGRRVPREERPDEWWEAQRAITPTSGVVYETNAVHRLGHDYLIVGRGLYYVAEETTVDGERAFETISVEEQARRDLAELEKYMPAVLAAKPVWADEPTLQSISEDEDDEFSVTYSRRNDFQCADEFVQGSELAIEQFVVFGRNGEVLRTSPVTPIVSIQEPRVDSAIPTPAALRALAKGIADMADELEPILAVN